MGLKPVWATEWDPAPENKKQSKRERLEDKGTCFQAQGHEFNPQALMVKGECQLPQLLSTCVLAVPCMCTHKKNK